MNRQQGNVGNVGDVLKHAALVALARLVAEGAAGRPVTWVDTHAFRLEAEAPLPRWQEALVRLPACALPTLRYVAAQHRLLAGGPYRCSTGLVLDRFSQRPLRVICAEAEPETREALRGALLHEGWLEAVVLEEAAALAQVAPAPGPLLALVDPFVLDEPLWRTLSQALLRLRDAELLCLVYTHDKGPAPTAWAPLGPGALQQPRASVQAGPHRLALYAEGALARAAVEALVELGFTAEE